MTLLCCRSIAKSSGSCRDVKHYSVDEFELSSEHIARQPTTGDHQSSDKLHSTAGVSHKARSTRVQQKDDQPVLSYTHSGNIVRSCFIY